MKIAALIRAYHRPEQLDLLLDRLSGGLWAPYVHIDAKSDIAAFAASRGKAVFLDERVQVNWGGLTQVDASVRLLREALRDPTVTHLYNMSGQCYPVKGDAEIEARLAAHPAGTANLMEMHAMPVSHKPLKRYTRRWPHDITHPVARASARLLFRFLPDQPLARLRGIELVGGGCWWLFERAAAEKLLAFLDGNPWYWDLFRHSDCPDEMLPHSLVKTLGITIGGGQPTGDVWLENTAHPETITPAMHRAFADGEALCARKYVSWHPALNGAG